MILRFRADAGQASNLRVRVYSQDRSTLLATLTAATVPDPITETIAGAGTYECEVGALTDSWWVVVDFIDTGEVTCDGFANAGYPEVVDTPGDLISGTISENIAAAITADVIAGLSGIDPAVISRFDPRTKRISITRGDDLNAVSGTHVDIPISLPSGVDGNACSVRFGAVSKDDSTERIDATVGLSQVAGRWYVRLELTSAETTAAAGQYDWEALVVETANAFTTVFSAGHATNISKLL